MHIFFGGHNSGVPLISGTEISLRNAFINAGFKLCEKLEEADALVLIDMEKEILEQLNTLQNHAIPRILVRLEPSVVWPSNYSQDALTQVTKVIDVGRSNPLEGGFCAWPQDWSQHKDYVKPVDPKNDRVALINGNKLSFIEGEMYSLRRQCIYGLDELDLFGVGWGLTFQRKFLIFGAEMLLAIRNGFFPQIANARHWFKKPNNWKGAPSSKLETLSEYKYTLVIENSIDYITEKLFDAFFARCIPIYVGPDLSNFNIPDELAIQVKPDLDSIGAGLKDARSLDYQKWKFALENWLVLKEVQEKWSVEYAYADIVSEASRFISEQSAHTNDHKI